MRLFSAGLNCQFNRCGVTSAIMSSTDTAVEYCGETSPPKKREKRNAISSAEKKIILNIYKNEMQLNQNALLSDVVKNAALCAGVSQRSVYRIVREYKQTKELTSPRRTKSRTTLLSKVDDFDKNAIRRKVHEFYFRNELPTIDKVLKGVNDDEDLPNFRRTTFYKLLKQLNFKHVGRGKKSALIEKEEIIVWRRKYLREIKKCRQEGRKIYYLDETWINAGHTKNKVWVDQTITSARQAFLSGLSTGLKNPSGKGKRLIVVHVGSDSGFLDGGLLVFESKKTGDYHDDMNAQRFEEWFERVLSQMEEGAVVVMDNASYHSRLLEKSPTTAWNKQQLKNWLASKNITFEEDMLKVELLAIARQHKPILKLYATDELAKTQNKLVVRLPPFHCELNPIELIWADVKNYVASKNTTFKFADVKILFEEAISQVTPEKWKNCVQHVRDKVEKQFWELDNIMEEAVAPLIINLNSDSSSESEFSDSSSD